MLGKNPSPAIRAVRVLLLVSTAALAQSNRGQIEGIVADPTGAAVPNVHVTIVSTDTNIATPTVTNQSGYYRALDLVPGTYTARFEAPGFATLELTGIRVSAATTTRADSQLKIDATRQTVQVTAEAPLIETGAANFSTTIETKSIQDIPLQGRDVQQLVFLIPGVNNVGGPPGSNFGFNSAYGSFPDPTNALGSNISVNGGQAGANAWLLDGNMNTSSFAENAVINPTPDAVGEFQAITNAFAAEYSRTGGAVFNVVLKSGTNSLHGNLYEFLRNDATNARNPFTSIDSSGNLIKSRQLRFNNFGGTFGGPVLLPKIYNGKNRTFFFVSFDQTILHLLGTKTLTVPTSRMRNGDFSEDPNVAQYGLYDPFSTVGPDANGLFSRAQLLNPNGTPATSIPVSRLDPTAMFYVKSFPLPNYNDPRSGCPMGADGYLICDNYLATIGTSQNPRKISLKLDHAVSDKNRLFAEWLYSPVPIRNYRVPWTGATFPYDQTGWRSNYPVDLSNWIVSLGNTYMIKPSLINEFRAGFSRQYMTTNPSHPYPDSITDQSNVQKILAQSRIPSDPFFPVPHIDITGAGGSDMSFGPTTWINMNTGAEAFTILDNLTAIVGRHTLKTGFVYRHERTSYESGFPTGFSFTGGLTNDPVSGNGGDGLADFMLGAVGNSGRNASTGIMWQPYERFSYWGFFLQDDVRLTNNFTLNLGIRYDLNGLFSVRRGGSSSFCLDCVNPLTGLKGKVIYEGVDKEFPTGPVAPANKDSIGPRVNFSWSPFADRKTVIRGGYDIFYSNAFSLVNSPGQAASNAPGLNQEFDWNGSWFPDKCAPYTGQCVAFPLSDTTVDKASLTTPPMSSGFPARRQDPLLGGFIQFFTPPVHDPMVQTWNLEVQRELPGNIMADIGYVGNHGTHLLGESFRQFNYVHTQDRLQYKTAINAEVPITDYFQGATAAALENIWGSPTLPRSILLQDYPAFGGIQNNVGFEGASIYHGLNARVQKRFSRGFQFIAAYTFSKKITNGRVANMDNMLVDPIHGVGSVGGRLSFAGGEGGSGFQDRDNIRLDRSVAPDDITHIFNLAGTYEIPIGKGRTFGNMGGVLNAIVGGWQLSGSFNAQSGLPLRVSCPSDQLTSRCNVIADPNFSGDRSKQQRIAQWMNPAAFEPAFGSDPAMAANYDPTDPRAWQFGTAGARLPWLRGPGFWNLDSALAKRFNVAEQKYFDLRWEIFNTLNHQNLALPNTGWCLPPLPDGSTDRVHRAGCSFGRITDIQTDPRSMEFVLKFVF